MKKDYKLGFKKEKKSTNNSEWTYFSHASFPSKEVKNFNFRSLSSVASHLATGGKKEKKKVQKSYKN